MANPQGTALDTLEDQTHTWPWGSRGWWRTADEVVGLLPGLGWQEEVPGPELQEEPGGLPLRPTHWP